MASMMFVFMGEMIVEGAVGILGVAVYVGTVLVY